MIPKSFKSNLHLFLWSQGVNMANTSLGRHIDSFEMIRYGSISLFYNSLGSCYKFYSLLLTCHPFDTLNIYMM